MRRIGRIVRGSRRTAAVVALGAFALPAVAVGLSRTSVRQGYYARLVGVSSADVELHVRSHGKIPDLVLGCAPAAPSPSSGTVDIAVHAPVLSLRAGRISYRGPAQVSELFGGAPVTGTTTLTISGYHVNGPVHHYTYGGRRLQQTTAFKGTVSSPACASAGVVRFTLFGPVPGE